MFKIFSFLTLLVFICHLNAQEGVGINVNSVDPSAIFEVQSTTQGMLIPRMTATQRDAISSPAQGLLVYVTTTNTFWFYNNANWQEIISSVSNDELTDVDNDTKVEVEQTADDDVIRFTMNGTEYFQMEAGRLNVLNTGNSVFFGNLAGNRDDLTDNRNVFVGNSSGQFNTSGQNNVGIGYYALRANTTGEDNVAIGEEALRDNTIGKDNISVGNNSLSASVSADSNLAVGHNSLEVFTTGTNNTALGYTTLQSLTVGSNNVAVGSQAFQNLTSGSNNTAIGRLAGGDATGSGNVFVGYEAGRNELGDNKLYIDNSATATPLIWGDFKEDSLVVNGDLEVTGDITYVGTLTDVSDRRLKDNFDTLKSVMHLVNKLQAYSYNMKSNPSSVREYGLIAQEVKAVFPEMVKIIDSENGYYGVNYIQLVSILIEGLKEQQKLINELKVDQGETLHKLQTFQAHLEEIKAQLK